MKYLIPIILFVSCRCPYHSSHEGVYRYTDNQYYLIKRNICHCSLAKQKVCADHSCVEVYKYVFNRRHGQLVFLERLDGAYNDSTDFQIIKTTARKEWTFLHYDIKDKN